MENSVSVDASDEPNGVGVVPDYFGFYVSEVAGLLNEGKDLHILSQTSDCEMNGGVVGRKIVNNDKHNTEDCLFSERIGTSLTEINRQRLHSLLRQSLTSLSQEVDEIINPAFFLCRLNQCLKYKKSLENSTAKSFEIDDDNPPLKRTRLSISSANSDTKILDVTEATEAASDGILKHSSSHPATRVSEVDDDFQLLLESDSSVVEEAMKKHADVIPTTIEHMDRMLEKLLYMVNSTCRPMTRPEKHNLKKLIQNLPPDNLERVAEIIQQYKPVVDTPFTEMHVDLEKEENVTLWKLYHYVKTVDRAWRQCRTHH
ncbi:hypothetical protein Leryth_013317 [Lithospermum erythrorhizon]|nr:hypothetical protein Leryth_013317 [Lithospermum erythrorhizon]